MDATPDYSKCSLRELRDIAERINRAQYPDRYALVLREIERRETAGAEAKTEARAPKVASPKRVPDAWVYVTVALAFLIGALVGAVICGVAASIHEVGDVPSAVPNIGQVIASAIGFFVGGIAGAQWRLRTIERS